MSTPAASVSPLAPVNRQPEAGISCARMPSHWLVDVSAVTESTPSALLALVTEAQQVPVPVLVFRIGAARPVPPLDAEQRREFVAAGQRLCRMIESAGKLAVAVASGAVRDELFELCLACHYRVADPQATFSFTGVVDGRLPRWGGLARLSRALGRSGALRTLLLEPSMDARAAARVGLIDEIGDAATAHALVDRVVQRIAGIEPDARSLLIRNVMADRGEAASLERFEAFHERFRDSLFRPRLEFGDDQSAYLRPEDAARNFSVVFDRDQEKEILKRLADDQVRFLFRQMIGSLDFEIRGRVLDMGAGSCWLSAECSRLQGVREVVAMELSDNELLVKAPAVLSAFQADMSKIRFVVGNFNAALFERESFDVVALARALHHSNDAAATLRQAASVLKPGGRLIAFDEHIVPLVMSRKRREAIASRTTVEFNLAEYKRVFAAAGLEMKAVPFFRDNPRRLFKGLTVNDRYLLQFTPRRWLNGVFHARFHLVGTKRT